MKKIALILLILALLFSGYTSPLDEQNPWGEVSEKDKPIYEIANNSPEGKRLTMLKENYSKDDECTKEKFVNKIKQLYAKYPDMFHTYVSQEKNINDLSFNFNQEEMQRINDSLTELKDFHVDFERKIKEIDGKFLVSYYETEKANLSSSFEYATIEVNPTDNSYKIIKDSFPLGTYSEKEVKMREDAFGLMGECLEAWAAGTAKVVFDQEYVNQLKNPKSCTQTGGNLLIKDYYFQYNLIMLRIQNTTENNITIENITSYPTPSTWSSLNEELEPNQIGRFDLKGSFTSQIKSEQLNEEIIITYTQNGQTKTEKTTCSGIV